MVSNAKATGKTSTPLGVGKGGARRHQKVMRNVRRLDSCPAPFVAFFTIASCVFHDIPCDHVQVDGSPCWMGDLPWYQCPHPHSFRTT